MSTVRKVHIIDDDDALRETLKEQFTLHDEFQISDAGTASAGLKQLKSDMVDLVLLDVRLPDMDGREACKQMRKSGYRGPIVMLTDQDTEADNILGFDSGANDYIAKPFRFGVLLARIRAQLRQLMEPNPWTENELKPKPAVSSPVGMMTTAPAAKSRPSLTF